MRDHSNHIVATRHEAVEGLMRRWSFERRIETVDLPDALGRIAARTVRALHELPTARISDMDGIGVRFDDFADGQPDIVAWKRGEQWQFCNTGVAMPEGFDTAVPIERADVAPDNETLRSIEAPAERFACTTEPGAALQPGDVLVRAGEELTPTLLSVLAMGGHVRVDVVARPRVAFIPSGNELVDAGGPLPAGKNVESNAVMACAKIAQWGGEPVRFGIVPDDPDRLLAALREATATADIVILNAGSSKGSDDYTCELLEEHGEMLFHELAQGPGKHCSFSLLDGTPVIGISGPPIGAEFTIDFYVKPFVDLYLSRPLSFPPTVRARMLDESGPGPRHMTIVKRAAVRRTPDGSFVAWCTANDERPVLRCTTRANGVVSLSPDLGGWRPGDVVDVELRWPYGLPPLFEDGEF